MGETVLKVIDGNEIIRCFREQKIAPSWQIIYGKNRGLVGLASKLFGSPPPLIVFLEDGLVIFDPSVPKSRQSSIRAFAFEAMFSLKITRHGEDVAVLINEDEHNLYQEPPIEILLAHQTWENAWDSAQRIETAWQNHRSQVSTFADRSDVPGAGFVTNTDNEAFVAGTSTQYKGASYAPGLVMGIAGFILLSLLLRFTAPVLFRSHSSSLQSFAALWVNALGAILLLAGVVMFYRSYRLKNQAITLYGELVTCHPEIDYESGAGENSSNERIYQLRIRYRFRTPDGAEFIRKADVRRDDLEGKSIPPLRIPVAVRYVSHRLFELL